VPATATGAATRPSIRPPGPAAAGRAGHRGAARVGADLAGEVHLLDHLGAGELLDAGIGGLRVGVAGGVLQEQAAAGGHLEIGAGRDRAGRRDLREGGARDRQGRGGAQHRGEQTASVHATVHHGVASGLSEAPDAPIIA
jgi:hypothetical protein